LFIGAWPNEEQPTPSEPDARPQRPSLPPWDPPSPVYSLEVEKYAVWAISGLEVRDMNYK